MRYCGQCGATISETAIFCERCGIKQTEIDSIGNLPQQGPGAKEDSQSDPNSPKPDIEELDLTKLDKKAAGKQEPQAGEPKDKPSSAPTAKQGDNIINLNDILESEEKVEADNSIKREVLADDDILTKICPMCGEEMEISSKLLANTPVLVKCLKCGQETKIW